MLNSAACTFTLIINASDIYGLDYPIVRGEADPFSDARSENRRHFVRCHARIRDHEQLS
jgi:hypothetical protein